MLGQGLKFEAKPPHPRRRHRSIEVNVVTGVDGNLPIERQTVGIFGHGDHRQQRLARQTTFDDVVGCRSLDHAIGVTEGIFGPVRHDHPEASRNYVEPFADVFADLDLREAEAFGGDLGLDHHFDPLKMGSKTLARTWRPLGPVGSS